MNPRHYLSIAILLLSSLMSHAGGSVHRDDLQGLLKTNPVLAKLIQRNFAIGEVGGAVRLGKHMGNLGGARIGPYEFPAVALRVAIGSATGFLIAQLIDVSIFQRLREGAWWRAPLASTLIGSTIDTVLFFTIAFSGWISFGANADAEVSWALDSVPFLLTGPDAPLWVSLAVADWGVKLAIALIALVPFRLIVGRLQQNP